MKESDEIVVSAGELFCTTTCKEEVVLKGGEGRVQRVKGGEGRLSFVYTL